MSVDLDSKLSQYLFDHQCIDPQELGVAAGVSTKTGDSLARVLQRMELLPVEQLQAHVLAALGFPQIDMESRVAHRVFAMQLGEAFCKQHHVLPLAAECDAETVDVVMLDPGDIVVADALRQRLSGVNLRLCMAELPAIERAHYQLFTTQVTSANTTNDAVSQLSNLLSLAVSRSASDIHLEPTMDCARIRLRCDGVLRLWRHISREQWQLLLGRIKVVAALDIADSRSAQDGRFAHSADGREVDIRVSVMPTDRGEAVVMRILDRNRHALNFESLGVAREQQESLLHMLSRPEGMVIVCGPTGSGKSTTLYALVESIRGEALNILTLEDPVEYPATWVRQTSINDAVSMDYAEGVRAAMRQDPDVMLIGEMRDPETAKIALRAAMTGHRVLATVHANSALASVGRLWDLGLQPSLLSGNLIGVVAQRLLRKLCQYCKIPDTKNNGFFVASGCEHCHQFGYLGRAPVLEIWPVDRDFDELLHQGASLQALEQLRAQKGQQNLMSAAISLLRSGVSSVEEVQRVMGPLPAGWANEYE